MTNTNRIYIVNLAEAFRALGLPLAALDRHYLTAEEQEMFGRVWSGLQGLTVPIQNKILNHA